MVPVISKTVKYTPYLLKDYGGITKYVHHVLSIPGAAQLLPTLGAFAQQWHKLIDAKEEDKDENKGKEEEEGEKRESPALATPPRSQSPGPATPEKKTPEGRSPATMRAESPGSGSNSQVFLRKNRLAVQGNWEPDDARTTCYLCNAAFTWSKRRFGLFVVCWFIYSLFSISKTPLPRVRQARLRHVLAESDCDKVARRRASARVRFVQCCWRLL